jgi:hypothetical protein
MFGARIHFVGPGNGHRRFSLSIPTSTARSVRSSDREGSGGHSSRIVALDRHQTPRPTVEEPTVAKTLV